MPLCEGPGCDADAVEVVRLKYTRHEIMCCATHAASLKRRLGALRVRRVTVGAD